MTMTSRNDTHRSPEHHVHLSVLTEGLEHAHHACRSGVSSCITSMIPKPAHGGRHTTSLKKHGNSGSPLVVPLAVRLIDFCANLMAADHTCQHRWSQ
jgi:hypothetical protein